MISNGESVTGQSLAKAASVGKSFANKVINEIRTHGHIIAPSNPKERNFPRGVGSKTLDLDDEKVLLVVYYKNPKACLQEIPP